MTDALPPLSLWSVARILQQARLLLKADVFFKVGMFKDDKD